MVYQEICKVNKREQFTSIGVAFAEGKGVILCFKTTATIKDYVVYVCLFYLFIYFFIL